MLSRGKSKLDLEKLQDSRNNSIAGSDITLSMPNTERRISKLFQEGGFDPLSPRPDIVVPMPVVPLPPTTNSSNSQKDGEVFILSNLSIKEVQNAAWNDDNRLYVLIDYSLNNCLRRSETQSAKSNHIQWAGNMISVPVSTSINEKLHHGELLKFFVYHECLAIQDKLVGLLEVFLPSLYLDNKTIVRNSQFVGDLYDSTNLVKRKRKGILSFEWRICKGKPSDSNYSPRVRDDASKVSKMSSLAEQRLESSSVMTKFVDVHDNQQDINGLSPSLVLAAANTLHGWENDDNVANPYYEDTKVYVPKPAKKTTNIDLMNNHDFRSSEIKRGISGNGINNRKDELDNHKRGIAMSKEDIAVESISHQANSEAIVPQRPKLERSSSHNSAATNNGLSVLTEKTKKSIGSAVTGNTVAKNDIRTSINDDQVSKVREMNDKIVKATSKNKKKSSKVAYHSTKSGFTVEHDITCIFDQAFYMALLKISASFTIRMKELIVLLDSLEIPVNTSYVFNSSGETNSIVDESNAWLEECVQLPINHSTSFAATIADILEQRPYILSNSSSVHTVILTENQSILAIKQLIQLIKGPYNPIRESILFSCGSKEKRSQDSQLSRRPRKISSDGMQQILRAMNLVRRNSEQNSAEQLFQNIDGKDFLELPATMLSSHYGITASVLQARVLAYQSTLQILDSAWDRGIRPQDPINQESSSAMSVADSHSTQSKEKGKSTRRKSERGNVREEDFEDFTEITILPQSGNSNNGYSTLGTPLHVTTNPSSSVQGSPTSSNGGTSSLGATSILKRSNRKYFQIADANMLFQAYISHNRAYGWGFSLANLTGLSNAIGGFFGYQVDASGLMPNSSGGNGENQSILSMPATTALENTFANNFNNRDMLWLMLDFPSEEVKAMTLHSLQNLLYPSLQQQSNGGSTPLAPFLMQIVSVMMVNSANSAHPGIVNNANGPVVNGNLNNTWGSFTSAALGPGMGSLNGAIMNNTAGGINGSIQTELCVCVLRRCCTLSDPRTVHSNAVSGTELLLRRIKHVSVDEIRLGMEARVVNFSILQRLCDRYDWFDKPSDDILHQFANKRVEIVSIAELISKQRVGVRLLKTNICDAIPIEALLPIQSSLSVIDEEKRPADIKGENVDNGQDNGKNIKLKRGTSEPLKDHQDKPSKPKSKKKKKRVYGSDDESSEEVESLDLENLSVEDHAELKKVKKKSDDAISSSAPNYTKPKSLGTTSTINRATSVNQSNNQKEKDLSWLKPVPKLHTQLFQFDQSGNNNNTLVVEDIVSPRPESPIQMPIPDENIPIPSVGVPQSKVAVWDAVLDLNQAEYTQGVIPVSPEDSPIQNSRRKTRVGTGKSAASHRPSSATGSAPKKRRDDDLKQDPIVMGIAGAGFNAAEKKWNEPIAVAPPATAPMTTTPNLGNKRPKSAVTAINQKKTMVATGYTPYQDIIPDVILPSENERTGLVGVALHIANAPRSEIRPSTASPSTRSPVVRTNGNKAQVREIYQYQDTDDALLKSPSDRNIKFEVNVSQQNKGHTKNSSNNEQDKLFNEVVGKVDEIRHKPKSLQEALYYNREVARTEREAQ